MTLIILIIAVILFFIVKAALNTDKNNSNSENANAPYVSPSIHHGDNSVTSRLGKAGESEVSFVLHSLPLEYLAIDDVIIPDQVTDPSKRYTTQIDHIVISRFGIS